MKLALKLMLLLFLSTSFSMTWGQNKFKPGYIITYNKDTIPGLLEYTLKSDLVVYKEKENSSVRKFQPSQILGFRFTDGKFFVSKEIQLDGKLKKVFLDFLVDGVADLYSYGEEKTGSYYIQRSGSELTKLNDEHFEYQNTLKQIFNDCPRLFKEINDTYYEEEPLMRLTKRFNDYVSSEKNVYYVKPPSIEFALAPFISLSNSSMDFNHGTFYDAFDFKSWAYPSIGMQSNISFPRILRILSFQTSLELGKSHYYANTLHPEYSWIFEEVNMRMVTLKGKAGFKFTYPKGIIRPSVLFGGDMLYLIHKDGIRYEERNIEQVISINSRKENITPRFNYGFDLDLGFDFHYKPSLICYLNAGYCFETGENTKRSETWIFLEKYKQTITANFRTFNVSAGVYF